MIFRLSTGFKKAFSSGIYLPTETLNSNTVEFTASQILDTGKLGGFARHDFIIVKEGVNAGVRAQVISGDNDQLTFAAGTFTAEAAGGQRYLEQIRGGAGYVEPMSNGILHLYSAPMPTTADMSEGSAVLLARLTRKGLSFAAGVSENGLNLEWDAVTGELTIAIDPETGELEEWKGVGLGDGTVTWGRFYANDLSTGASTDAVRFDGDAGDTSSSLFYMPNGRLVTLGGNVTVTKGAMAARGAL
jgi:hypothetical protein